MLTEVYDFYSADGMKRKARFEAVAEVVSEFIISESHGQYRRGWITRGSGDGGVDFVGRLDVGSGFSKASLVVLGQAKCEAPTSSTSGKDIARTVARLRRGWIGCYVTTGTFSTHTQREVADDRYPLLLVPGGRLPEQSDDGGERRGFGRESCDASMLGTKNESGIEIPLRFSICDLDLAQMLRTKQSFSRGQ